MPEQRQLQLLGSVILPRSPFSRESGAKADQQCPPAELTDREACGRAKVGWGTGDDHNDDGAFLPLTVGIVGTSRAALLASSFETSWRLEGRDTAPRSSSIERRDG
jgi:hypothetical protein